MLADTVRQRLADWLAKPRTDRNAQLDVSLRLLSKWRSTLIQNTVQHHNGTRIWSGPFEGMDFLPQSTHGCHVAKLIGCYEQPLQPFIEEAMRTAYPVVVNIGCAEGYYGAADAGYAGGRVRHRPGGAAGLQRTSSQARCRRSRAGGGAVHN